METMYLFLLLRRKMMFKSYYVVWKQFKQKTNKQRNNGLNRTMQYGNFIAFPKPSSEALV